MDLQWRSTVPTFSLNAFFSSFDTFSLSLCVCVCVSVMTLPSPCGAQALQQVARRTLVTSSRRQWENKVPQKQKLFQVKRTRREINQRTSEAVLEPCCDPIARSTFCRSPGSVVTLPCCVSDIERKRNLPRASEFGFNLQSFLLVESTVRAAAVFTGSRNKSTEASFKHLFRLTIICMRILFLFF